MIVGFSLGVLFIAKDEDSVYLALCFSNPSFDHLRADPYGPLPVSPRPYH